MKHFANKDKKPFGELTDEEQACLARACTEDRIQFWNVNEWMYLNSFFSMKDIYRTKPNSLEGQIPWNLIDDKFVAFAVDKDMSAWFFDKKPKISVSTNYNRWTNASGLHFESIRNLDEWISESGLHFESILKLDLDGIDWKESLVMRPGHE